MNQFTREDRAGITVNAFDNVRRDWLEAQDAHTQREILKRHWDNAIELAHLSLRAARVFALRPVPESIELLDEFATEVYNVSDEHKQKSVNSRPDRHWRDHDFTPEPYFTLDHLTSMHKMAVAKFIRHGKVVPIQKLQIEDVDPSCTGPKLLTAFQDAIGEIIGPENYIEGMDPYKDPAPVLDPQG